MSFNFGDKLQQKKRLLKLWNYFPSNGIRCTMCYTVNVMCCLDSTLRHYMFSARIKHKHNQIGVKPIFHYHFEDCLWGFQCIPRPLETNNKRLPIFIILNFNTRHAKHINSFQKFYHFPFNMRKEIIQKTIQSKCEYLKNEREIMQNAA